MLSMETARGENPALSYRNLRAIIGYAGLALPVALLLTGVVDGHVEGSISAYYYTKVGNVLTGTMCVIGVFLVAYRLTSWTVDNIATTLAGICALGVAFFHAAPQNATLGQLRLADVHLTCAAALFVLLGAISLLIFPLDVLPSQRWRAKCYMGLGALIWLSIVLMPTLKVLATSFYDDNHVFFILETVCVMAFAVSFILKGHGQPSDPDLDKMAADRRARPSTRSLGPLRSGSLEPAAAHRDGHAASLRRSRKTARPRASAAQAHSTARPAHGGSG